MVRIVMAAVGVLFICLGSYGIGLGILLLLPGVITILVKIAKGITRKVEDAKYWERMAAEKRERELAEENRKKEAVEQQNKLTEHYKNSPMIKEILSVISGGSSKRNTPDQIVIKNHCIQGLVDGEMFTYDFAANRVHALPSVIRTINSREELKYVVRPQMAIADGINSLLGNMYAIYDNAKETTNFHTDIDGDSYTTITYSSDHITMVLKTTLPNKHL